MNQKPKLFCKRRKRVFNSHIKSHIIPQLDMGTIITFMRFGDIRKIKIESNRGADVTRGDLSLCGGEGVVGSSVVFDFWRGE